MTKRWVLPATLLLVVACHRSETTTSSTTETTATSETAATTSTVPATDTTPTYATTSSTATAANTTMPAMPPKMMTAAPTPATTSSTPPAPSTVAPPSATSAPTTTMSTAPPPPATSASSADGAAIFAANCTGCHGKSGNGDTAIGKKNNIPDFHSADVQSLSDAELARIIREGKGSLSKVAHPGKHLTPDQVNAVVAYIRTLK